MIVSLANKTYRILVLFFLWNIFREINLDLVDIPFYIHLLVGTIVGAVCIIGNPK